MKILAGLFVLAVAMFAVPTLYLIVIGYHAWACELVWRWHAEPLGAPHLTWSQWVSALVALRVLSLFNLTDVKWNNVKVPEQYLKQSEMRAVVIASVLNPIIYVSLAWTVKLALEAIR